MQPIYCMRCVLMETPVYNCDIQITNESFLYIMIDIMKMKLNN